MISLDLYSRNRFNPRLAREHRSNLPYSINLVPPGISLANSIVTGTLGEWKDAPPVSQNLYKNGELMAVGLPVSYTLQPADYGQYFYIVESGNDNITVSQSNAYLIEEPETIPIQMLGTNGSYKRVYYSGKILDENLAMYSGWSGDGSELNQPVVNRHGELTMSPVSAGISQYNRGIIAPRAANNRVRISFTVVGTPTVTMGGGYVSNLVVNLAQGYLTYTSGSGDRLSGFNQLLVSGNGYITNVDARDCGPSSLVPLYPEAEFAPDMVAEYKNLYRGAYYRPMDETNANDYLWGARVEEIRTDWEDRNMGNGWVAPKIRAARATIGTGNSGFRIYVRHPVVPNSGNQDESWNTWSIHTSLKNYLPWHPYGAAGNNITVQLSSPGTESFNMTVDSSGKFLVILTPPTGTNTAAQIVAWINSHTEARKFFSADLYNLNGTAPLGNGSGNPGPTLGIQLTGGYFEGVRDGIGQEKVTRFCREAEMRPWYVVPASASVDYIEGLAQHIADELPPTLWPCVIEFIGNESTWSDGFPNHYIFRAKGLKANPSDPTPADSYCASTTVAMVEAIRNILPDEAFRAAYNTQNAGTFHVNRFINKPGIKEALDDLCIAPYWIPATYNTGSGETADQILDAAYASLKTWLDASAQVKALAEANGLRLTAYEGGQHARIDNGSSSTRRIEYARHPRQTYIYGVFFAEWIRRFNTPFCHFQDVYLLYQSNLGFSWGLEDHMGEWLSNPTLAPKKEGYVRVINSNYPPYAELGASAPNVSGGNIVGQILTINLPTVYNGSWDIKWKRGSETVGTSQTYTRTASDIDQNITVELKIIPSNLLWSDIVYSPIAVSATQVYVYREAFTSLGANKIVIPQNAPSEITLHLIGPGGRGRVGLADASGGRGGGGGGAYVRKTINNVIPGQEIDIFIPSGGSEQFTWAINSTTARADYGRNTITGAGGTGGLVANCIGDATTAKEGGTGGTAVATYQGSGGGGGAAGPYGAGRNGGGSSGAQGGGGGGGANGGTNGTNSQNNFNSGSGVFNAGGLGGAARDGTAGGARGLNTNGGNGSNGSGGGGAAGGERNGGNGSSDPYWTLTNGQSIGPGSGGGGGGDNYGWAKGGSGGLYGGGSGGGTANDASGPGNTQPGQGLIVMEFIPTT